MHSGQQDFLQVPPRHNITLHTLKGLSRVFQIAVRGGRGGGIFSLRGIFLLGSGNLRRSDFDNLNLF